MLWGELKQRVAADKLLLIRKGKERSHHGSDPRGRV